MAEQATATFMPALPPTLTEFLARFDSRQKMGAAAALALAIAIIVGAWLWAKEPPYAVLFSNLNDQDGGQIVTMLQQQNVPYKHADTGNAILVPASQVHDVRLRMASQGLPKGGLVGFEVMENQKLGISQFAEQINYQRGLEGELARSIQTLDAIKQARVHLAIPKQTAFLRDEQKPSASVLVSLDPMLALDKRQIAGIVHLVSSSVPQLKPENVSVIDQNGNLISQIIDPEKQSGLDPTQLKYAKQIEAQYLKRIESILEPVLGKNNFSAQVTTEIDFSHIDQVAESYRPNPVPETAVRSQQTTESNQSGPQAMGVPGALTNQPPVPATAPITNPQVGGGAAGAGQNTGPFTRNATINYEVDKTVRHTRGVPGIVSRLSVAVAVNFKPGPAVKGKPGPLAAPSDEEMKHINNLVRDAVGFSQARGDSISVAAAAFVPPEPETILDIPLWKDPEMVALGRELGKYLVFALIALLVWLRLLKPVFDMIAATAHRVEAEEEQAAEAAEEEEAIEEAPREPTFEEKLQAARKVALDNPKLVAELIREWMGAGT